MSLGFTVLEILPLDQSEIILGRIVKSVKLISLPFNDRSPSLLKHLFFFLLYPRFKAQPIQLPLSLTSSSFVQVIHHCSTLLFFLFVCLTQQPFICLQFCSLGWNQLRGPPVGLAWGHSCDYRHLEA